MSSIASLVGNHTAGFLFLLFEKVFVSLRMKNLINQYYGKFF
jgi:hypothetical protein